MPTPLAREQVTCALARKRGVGRSPTVWTWDDLWRSAFPPDDRQRPALLPKAASRALLIAAIGEARRDGLLVALEPVAETPGVLARLRQRIASWTRRGEDPRRQLPDHLTGIVAAEEWEVYGRYRAILQRLNAEDEVGFAQTAARRLGDESPHPLHAKTRFFLVDPLNLGTPGWRAIEAFDAWAEVMVLTVPFDPDLPEPHGPAAALRDRLLDVGFEEAQYPHSPNRPAGLLAVARDAFAENPHAIRDRTDGLSLLGAPRGEGEAAVIARRVRELVDSGVRTDAILLLSRSRSDLAGLVAETLGDWGLPARLSTAPPLSADPGVAALLLAAKVAARGWASSDLMALLRHGRFRPDWPETLDPLARPIAAAAVRDTRVFRDAPRLLDALRAAAAEPPHASRDDLGLRRRRYSRATVALPILVRLAEALDGLDRPAPWLNRVDQLRALADTLGIAEPGSTRDGLAFLFDALDDHGEALDALGRGDEPQEWPDFALAVEALVRDSEGPAAAAEPGTLRLLTVAEAEGATAEHVILFDLAEGNFPDRASLSLVGQDNSEGDSPGDAAFAREQWRFLNAVGSARTGVTMVYPTTDEKGQALLAAGFLDDVRRAFAEGATPPFAKPIARIDPALMPADLAGSAADARVRAVARAASTGATHDLRRLARSPSHREPLQAVARALRVSRSRLRDPDFGRFDGVLQEPSAIRRVAEDFATDRHVFSPSQLESLATCPFQFFQRYVLKLEPPDDRDELDDDHAGRGSLIHQVLEQLHATLDLVAPEPGTTLLERVAAGLEVAIDQALDRMRPDPSDIAPGLRAIRAGDLRKLGRRYRHQFESYGKTLGASAQARHFEVHFGESRQPDSPPPLRLGVGTGAFRMMGRIDRIDIEDHPNGPAFRVIDYKSSAGPQKSDFELGLALQLPLYMLAVERLDLTHSAATPRDAGYWSLKGKGYAPSLKPPADDPASWESDAARFERFALALVDQLRRGAFPVRPRKEGCEDRCDFRDACRIAQVRVARKDRSDEPRMEPPR